MIWNRLPYRIWSEVSLSVATLGRPARLSAPVVCLGDSLTAANYPATLSRLLGVPVRNLGIGGQTSPQIAERFDAEGCGTVVLWMGNNNFHEPDVVVSDIARCVEMAGERRVLVLGLVNGDFDGRRKGEAGYDAILSCNDTLARTYGERFLDVRAVLRGAASRKDGLSLERDVIPESLRVDQIHLTRRGYDIVARAVFAALT